MKQENRESAPGQNCPPRGPIAPALLEWFYRHRRSLPFREDPTPYHIWVSEIMLQQTRMTAAVPYYLRFIQALPTVVDLARCPEDQLAKLWEGLGYYSRMRNLQKAARVICEKYGGALPASLEELKKLPGVGEYTAGAIASIGFGLPAPAVDGNVLRVFSRLWRDERDISTPAAKKECAARVMTQQPPEAAGDFNQALMELGALVCLPGTPDCAACPLKELCSSDGKPDAARLPVKAPRAERKVRPVTVVLARSEQGFLLGRRGRGGRDPGSGPGRSLRRSGRPGHREAPVLIAVRNHQPSAFSFQPIRRRAPSGPAAFLQNLFPSCNFVFFFLM